MDSQLEESQGNASGSIEPGEGRTKKKTWARGRLPAPAPDYQTLPAKLISLVSQRFAFLNAMFNSLPDQRDSGNCLYTAATILWMVTAGFICRKGTRNAMDVSRNTGMNPAHLMALSGQSKWPDGRTLSAPCTQTATRFPDALDPLELENILVASAQSLVRAKILDSAKMQGWLLIAIDGTKEENYRRLSAPWRRKYRYVLHAKIIGPDGTAFTILAEPCDSYDSERGKLDCERAAFQRLARRLKAAFPRQPICLLGDALFACEAVYSTCEQFEWKFIFTMKEGSAPAVWGETVELLALNRRNGVSVTRKNFRQDTQWVQGVNFGIRPYQVVFQGEVDGTTLYFNAWVTNFSILSHQRAQAIASAGRSRSRIEESYNVQKNGGFGLEHAFRETGKGAANYHLLMQLAHFLWQVLCKGWLKRVMPACRKLTDTSLCDLLAAALITCPLPATPLPAFQLRFADG